VITLRDLASVAECRAVVRVQDAVWGTGSEIVPASVLVVSAKRGGILIGAYRDRDLVGFVWSMPGWRDGQPTQWSHMLGIVPEARGERLGERLKLAQRDRAIAAGIDLIEWTFDPLQAQNAHLNFATLGAIAATYLVDAYGDMSGPLHRGTATDRLIAEWWLRRPHVERRLARRTEAGRASLVARSAGVLDAPEAIDMRRDGRWHAAAAVCSSLTDSRVLVPVPADFTDLQRAAPALAQEWRRATREVFQAYFSRGYHAVDFWLDRDGGGGRYLLARQLTTNNQQPTTDNKGGFKVQSSPFGFENREP
jgi:predicted GNAT superfamily acetyltransferase